MEEEKRYTPSVSLKESEKQALVKKANEVGVSYTRYMREVALGELPQDADDFNKYDRVEVLQDLKYELNMIGKNINQLTRVAHQSENINSGRLRKMGQELHRLKMEILDHLS